jgi:hypothetical protein
VKVSALAGVRVALGAADGVIGATDADRADAGAPWLGDTALAPGA